jgi:phosphatidylserine/phosphatidylglycerophosphate/cardiolipin synthase-like enzyme
MSKYIVINFFVLLIVLVACSSTPKEFSALKQDKFVQVYFNHQEKAKKTYKEPYRKIERNGDNLEEIIIDSINSAKSSIDVAVMEFNLPKLAQALTKQAQKGIKVRVIVDNDYSRPLSELTVTEVNNLTNRGLLRRSLRDRHHYEEIFTLVDQDKNGNLSTTEINQGDALIILKNAGIPIIDDTEDGSKGSGLMHHKFVIIDRQVVVTGSPNFTISDIHGDFANLETRGNTNNLLKIENSQLANIFTEEFNYMWGDGVGGATNSLFGLAKPIRNPVKINLGTTNIEIHFSPTSPTQPWSITSNGLIGETLNQAKQSIDLALFVFSEQKLVDILAQKQQQGVTIKGIFEPEFATRYYSEMLDMLGIALSDRCKYEDNNNPWLTPIHTVGIAQLTEGDKMHHKFAVIDHKTVITGSHNWSAAANENNDETVLIIDNSLVAKHYEQQFDQLYNQAELGIPEYLPAKAKKQDKKCFSH